ncbi:CheY-like chemotaxis protein [Oceanisphaera litoralis]|uniref:response regulator n=1 Tax=Oceanisphaera litoralis TaxID=225144 RepID=UPI0019584F09|nr:response regulator [Oceanisphaera litoralis]MBM7456210.1 CheY-like chemotaxis protein [Oceanisphaera litoralis]
MDILILEDDLLVAELVDAVLTGAMFGVRVRHAANVAEARAAWTKQPAQLVICDWHLPDGTGLELVKLIRLTDQKTPIVMVSARSNRDRVMAAARHGINEFIAKPFDVATLQQRLLPLLIAVEAAETPTPGPESSPHPSLKALETWLDDALTETLRLPSNLDPEAILPLLAKSDELSAVELTRLWKTETTLSARFLNLANSASMRRSGKPVTRLDEAITTIGVDMALRNAVALSLDITASLHDKRLLEQGRLYLGIAEQVAGIARAMALSIGLDGLSCYTAGLLSRIGELAVLRTMQDFINQGGEIKDSDIVTLIARWGPHYGNHLKQQWKLPLPVRELIGAIHMAPTHTTQRPLLIMHLAALRVGSRLNNPEALRMLRQSGLDVEKWLPMAENEPLSPVKMSQNAP